MDNLNFLEALAEFEQPADFAQAVAVEAAPAVNWNAHFDYYLSLPDRVVALLCRTNAMEYREWDLRPFNDYLVHRGLWNEDLATNLLTGMVMRPLLAGWNSCNAARTIKEVNGWLVYRGEVEFVPVLVDGTTVYYCNRVRYESVPILPLHPAAAILANSFIRPGATLSTRVYPNNLLNIVKTSQGKQWRGVSVFQPLLAYDQATCRAPAQIASYAGMHIITQAANALLDYNSADAAKLLPISKTGRSIFQTCVAQWNDFFCAVGTDRFGAITNDRLLATLFPSGVGFFGECSGVVKWLAGPCALKLRNYSRTYIDHVFIDYASNSEWPAKCVMYAITPEDVKFYQDFTRTPVKALVVTLTSLVDSNQHLLALAQFVNNVKLTICFTESPIVIIEPTLDGGLAISSISSNFAKLETLIVECALENIRARLTGQPAYCAFEVTAAQGYAPGVCSVNFLPKLTVDALCCEAKQYMSMDDNMKRLFHVSTHTSDVFINGRRIRAVEQPEVVANYPRAMPAGCGNYTALFTPGEYYAFDNNGVFTIIYNHGLNPPDIYNWKKANREMKDAPEVFRGIPKPQAAPEPPKEEGEIPEPPGTPQYVPPGSPEVNVQMDDQTARIYEDGVEPPAKKQKL